MKLWRINIPGDHEEGKVVTLVIHKVGVIDLMRRDDTWQLLQVRKKLLG